MLAENLINTSIPPLKLSDSIQTALNWMDKLRVSELPVTDKGAYMGLITEDQILNVKAKAKDKIGSIEIYSKVFVHPQQHYFELIKVAAKDKVKMIGVVSEEGEYLGVVPLKDTISMFSQMSAMQGTGAILELSMDERNYSLAEISRLIEENNVKILSVHVGPDISENNGRIRVTVKLNTTDDSRVIATLERFEYNIVATFSSDELDSKDTDRLDMLFHYLNI